MLAKWPKHYEKTQTVFETPSCKSSRNTEPSKKQGNKDVSLVIKQIKRTEKLRNRYKTHMPKLTPDKIQKGGLSYVKVLQPDGSHKVVADPDELKRYLLKRNSEHYCQAKETIFGQEPLPLTRGILQAPCWRPTKVI